MSSMFFFQKKKSGVCAAEVGREKEPTGELFCLALFRCSEMTVSRKIERVSTKMGRVEYRNTVA